MQEVQIGSSFLRFVEGKCEKVTWFKFTDGTKFSKVEPFNVGAIELNLMAQSKHGEVAITKYNKYIVL